MSHIVFKKKRFLNRLVPGALVVAVAAGSALLLDGVANASPPAPGTLGAFSVNPATGTDLTAAAAQLPVACPTGSTSMGISILGPVAADGTVATTATFATPYPIVPQAIPSTSGAFSTPFAFDFKDAAADRGGASNLMQAGQYNFIATCNNRSGVGQGTFTSAIYFTGPTAYTSTDPNASPTTTTVLTTTPASTATQGATVTLNAAITPTPSSATVAGTVQFKDGPTNINGPVALSNGTASTTTSTLTTGSHQLTAVFTSTAANVAGSTSAPVTFVVGVTPSATATSLTVAPSGPVLQGASVTLTGSVTSTAGTPAGSIQFKDGGTNLGAAVPVNSGTATTSTTTLTPGSHQLSANFVPTDPTAFAASSSQPTALTVTGTGPPPATETITTTITAGSLVISVANTNVVLPTPVLNPAGTLLTTSGRINPVTVVDTRADNPGWTVSGQVSDFSDGSNHAINGGNLGWVPNVVDKATSQTVTAGGTIAPDNGIEPMATPASGVGLSTSRTLATAAASAGIGTAHLDALLNLSAPTSTPAGTYNATLTLTAI